MATRKKKSGRSAPAASTALDRMDRKEKLQLERLTKKARAEIAALLKAAEAGTLTRLELEAKLKELDHAFLAIHPFGFGP